MRRPKPSHKQLSSVPHYLHALGRFLLFWRRSQLCTRRLPSFKRFATDRYPRTAIGRLESGKILLVTVDGRQPGVSAGMSLQTLAELLMELGATDGINLDGGGSTTMVVHKKMVNRPSDQTGERPVSDAILVFSKPN